MRITALIFVLILVACAAIGYGVHQENSKPVPVPAVELMPKQSHYVVFFHICGVLEGIMLTTNPPIFASENKPADAYTLELMREALSAERFVDVQHWRGYCPKPEIKAIL